MSQSYCNCIRLHLYYHGLSSNHGPTDLQADTFAVKLSCSSFGVNQKRATCQLPVKHLKLDIKQDIFVTYAFSFLWNLETNCGNSRVKQNVSIIHPSRLFSFLHILRLTIANKSFTVIKLSPGNWLTRQFGRSLKDLSNNGKE